MKRDETLSPTAAVNAKSATTAVSFIPHDVT